LSGQRKIGLLGGTFDPIHVGHLIAAEYAREAAGLDEVLFIPAGEPPHKESRLVTPVKHRYMMTLLATVTNPHFNVSRVEIERKGKSFTVDTIRALKEQLGASAELYFILGSDSMADVPNWHQPERLLSLCHFSSQAAQVGSRQGEREPRPALRSQQRTDPHDRDPGGGHLEQRDPGAGAGGPFDPLHGA